MDGQSWYDDAESIIAGTTTDNTCCNERYVDMVNAHSIITEKYQYIWRATSLNDAGKTNTYFSWFDEEQIYDLSADPSQQNNIISDNILPQSEICDFRNKMIDYSQNVACFIESCTAPDIGFCTTEPTSTTTSTTDIGTSCESVTDPFKQVYRGVSSSDSADEAFVNAKIDETKTSFVASNGNCVTNENEMDFVYQVRYRRRISRLIVELVVCCGDGKLLTDEQIPDGYQRAGSAFSLVPMDGSNGETKTLFFVFGASAVFGILLMVFLCFRFSKARQKASIDRSGPSEIDMKEVEVDVDAEEEALAEGTKIEVNPSIL